MINILIVEDDKNVCILLETYFGSYDFAITSAHNEDEAIKLLNRYEYEVVLTDIRMKDENGGFKVVDEVSRINSERYSPSFIPVIVLTAITDKDIHDDIVKSGAYAVFTKTGDDKQAMSLLFNLIRNAILYQREHAKNIRLQALIDVMTEEFGKVQMKISESQECICSIIEIVNSIKK